MLRILLTAALLLTAPLAQAAATKVDINNYTFMPGKIIVHPGDRGDLGQSGFHAAHRHLA